MVDLRFQDLLLRISIIAPILPGEIIGMIVGL